MNNFNMNWLFNPPPPFGMGMPNRNGVQNAVPPSDPLSYEEEGTGPTGCSQGCGVKPGPPGCLGGCGEMGLQGPRGETGPRGPEGPAGYPQNSIFATFSGQETILPESANLLLKTEIPDITQNISLCDSHSVSAVTKRHGFISITPIFNNCEQPLYGARAEASKKEETLTLSRYFIVGIPEESLLFFAWQGLSLTSGIGMNLSVEKLCRQ